MEKTPAKILMPRTHELLAIRSPSGEMLRGDLFFADSPGTHAVVFVHGFASHRNGEKSLALQVECARRGWTFAAIDCRGHGESEGKMRDLRGTRLIEDLAALRNHLATRGIQQLFLVGSSMGGFASAWFALGVPEVKSCAFIAPAFRFVERRWNSLSDLERAYWKAMNVVRYKNDWVDVEVGYCLVEEVPQFQFDELVRSWTKPAIIFHGLADTTVPATDSIDFQAQANGNIELRLFKQGDHRLTELKDEMAREACRFFEHQLTISTCQNLSV